MTATIRSPLECEPTPLFLLSIDLADGSVAIHGDLDREHADLFLETFQVLTASGSSSWSVDVAAVTFCDAGGLRALLDAKRAAGRAHRSFRITRAGPWMRHLLPMVGLGAVAEPPRTLRAVP